MIQIAIDAPSSLTDLRRQLHSVAEQTADYWSSLEPAMFFAPIGDAWSPAENVRHLVQSNRPVTYGLRSPKLALMLRFGFTFKGSRSYAQILDVYRTALSGGLKAFGRYLPRPMDAEATETTRDELVAKNRVAIEGVVEGLDRWSESSLDKVCVAHPALGKMTVREILFFTLYHNAHHAESVARKLAS
ncbi:MAG: DinB family protein [Thermoanaerobaculia bacterium]|nr:DinB family protein [Thermoanaerobaculia bacterium]